MSIRSIDQNFHVTGQLSPSHLQQVAEAGYRTVVCMRPDNEGFEQPRFEDMEKAGSALGIEFIHIPVIPGQVSLDQARKLKDVLFAKDGPVLAYCASGQRCAAVYQMTGLV